MLFYKNYAYMYNTVVVSCISRVQMLLVYFPLKYYACYLILTMFLFHHYIV